MLIDLHERILVFAVLLLLFNRGVESLLLFLGRWTREEHNLFLRGLELHGKGWKKIAALIKSRTVVQIRTHAQKYFLKMHKARQDVDASGNFFEGKSHSSYRKVLNFYRLFCTHIIICSFLTVKKEAL